MALVEFLEHLCRHVVPGRTTPAHREKAALYLRSVCLGIGRPNLLTRNNEEWAASSLARLGNPLGAQRKRRRVMPGVKKELVETTHSLRGSGVTKVSQVAMGYEVARKGGHVKRGLTLADLSLPNKVASTGGVGMALSLEENDGSSNARADVEALSPEENGTSQGRDKRHLYISGDSNKCETHYAWNYHLSTRLAFNQEVRRGTMSLDGTDVGNGKIVTCVVGDMDRDLHGWAPPVDST